ncbi:hypothetical protein MSAN_02250300 [Mycena sanguinolenta]|uniref:Uncharacterized protein n=1 Tax=Mycena sanguinolenta TaxID=230812 RepID=A0A8H7CHN0_9AGAR|nr:hypothetical protein MSAN_02250300 [Mycena sanguinolenta]
MDAGTDADALWLISLPTTSLLTPAGPAAAAFDPASDSDPAAAQRATSPDPAADLAAAAERVTSAAADHVLNDMPSATPAMHKFPMWASMLFLGLCTLAMPLPLSLSTVVFVFLRIIWVAFLFWRMPFEADPDNGIYYAVGLLATIILWLLGWCDGGTQVSIFRVGVGLMAATGAYVLSTLLRQVDLREMGLLGLLVSRLFMREIYEDPHLSRSGSKQLFHYP